MREQRIHDRNAGIMLEAENVTHLVHEHGQQVYVGLGGRPELCCKAPLIAHQPELAMVRRCQVDEPTAPGRIHVQSDARTLDKGELAAREVSDIDREVCEPGR